MTSRRSRLFKYLRFWFFANLVLFVVLVSWFIYLRVQRSRLLDVVERQLAYNLKLSADLAFANDILTNRYFSAASDFASNVLSSAASIIKPDSSFVSSPSVSPSSPSAPVDDLPPLSFSNYFEMDGLPYVYLRRKYYKVGDIVLGSPIEDISPDVVKYRGKYFKVDQNEK